MPNHDATYPPTRHKAQRTVKYRLKISELTVARAIWILVVTYCESYVWWASFYSCRTKSWTQADHRLALIGDPQLVDENTYARRGLALRLTQFFTDLYMRRNYRIMFSVLDPTKTIFLGDLFDGGREWANEKWVREYDRFRSVFPARDTVLDALPGNHDVGIADGIKPDVLARFAQHFGQSSQLIHVGEWDLVLLDTVSLSSSDPEVNHEALTFLEHLPPPIRPRVLISHVALYREPDTPCGPLRESPQGILIQQGYQYQNVLLPDLSERIRNRVQPKVVFAGDDHDYCDYVGPGDVHEINVKSFSWAMGIAKPGLQLVELKGQTYHTELCLLPHPLHYFAWYGLLGLATAVFFRTQPRLLLHVTWPACLAFVFFTW
ncbi:hypothetical protein PYCC9005_004202 [Savitreella phatthalungensis]